MDSGTKYRVLHETHYEYSETIAIGRQMAHLRPRVCAWQRVLAHQLEIDPQPSERSEDTDYFGNHVVRFAVEAPHEALIVRAQSTVDIAPHAPGREEAGPAWESALATPGFWGPGTDLDVVQFRLPSPMAPILRESAAYASSCFSRGRPWLEAMLELTHKIHADFVYDPKATTVTTPVSEVLQHRRGVCQDFAHLMISCLRSLGLSARYVSGYVINRVPEGKQRMAGADASHAWISSHCPGLGWVDYDPTNGKLADEEFITLGWGREFSDVSPLRGVVLGAGTQKLSVAVSVQPLGISG
jgi:transglutaminase-like putative cysteine protease